MVSEKQRIANCNNSLRSTGPRTFEGKKTVSRNAVRHGLLSNVELTVIKGEDRTEFKEFSDNLRGDLKPVGQLESILAERIASFFWRLKRTSRMEKGLLDIISSTPQDAGSPNSKSDNPIAVIIHKTYDESVKDKEYQEYLKSKGRLDAKGVALPAPIVPEAQSNPPFAESESKPAASGGVVLSEEQLTENLGRMVQQDFKGSKLLEKLLRYEGQIERSLYRAMLELQKLQFVRTRSESIDILEDAVESDLGRGEPMCSPADAEKPNKPISEIENGNLKMGNPSESSPSFQGGLPQSGEGVLNKENPTFDSRLLASDACNAEKPNKAIWVNG